MATLPPVTASRDAILAAGVRLLHERGLALAVTSVGIADAAHAAGYTAGAAYRHWPTQESFHEALAVAALRWRDRSSYSDVIESIRGPVDEGAPVLEVIRIAAQGFVERNPGETDAFLTLALRAAAHGDDDLATEAARRVADGLAEHAQVWRMLVAWSGRRVRPPFTIEHVTEVLAALGDGVRVQDVGRAHTRMERELGEGVGSEWTLFGAAVQAVVEFFTEPVAPASAPADLSSDVKG